MDGRVYSKRSNLTSEVLYLKLYVCSQGKPRDKRKVKYADEAIVVMNITPMKASNGLEEKT